MSRSWAPGAIWVDTVGPSTVSAFGPATFQHETPTQIDDVEPLQSSITKYTYYPSGFHNTN